MCPKCGKKKERKKATYCNACFAKYVKERNQVNSDQRLAKRRERDMEPVRHEKKNEAWNKWYQKHKIAYNAKKERRIEIAPNVEKRKLN